MNTELPAGWAETIIGEISNKIHYGYTAKSSKEPTGTKLLRITDIQNNNVIWEDVPYCKISDNEKKKYLLDKDDLVFARTGATVGKSFLIPRNIPETVFASYLIRVILDSNISPKLVYNYFQSSNYWVQIKEGSAGIGQPNVNATKLANIKILLPPFPEQNKIVAKIDELFSRLDAGIEALKKTQALLKKYRQSVLKSAVEGKLTSEWRKQHKDELEPGDKLLERILKERKEKWEVEQLANYKAKGIKPPKDWKDKYKEPSPPDTSKLPELQEGWIWASLENISEINPKFNRSSYSDDLDVSFIPMKCVSEVSGAIDLSEKRKFSDVKKGYTPFIDGDIIFAKITPCMENGKIAIVSDLVNKIGFGSTEFHVFRLPEGMPKEYLFYFLVQDIFRKNAEKNMTGSVGQKRVPVDFLKSSVIPIPPIPEQSKICEKVDRLFSVISKIETVVESEIIRSKSLRQSILKQAFEGNLVPQDPNDEPASVLLERIKAEKTKLKN